MLSSSRHTMPCLRRKVPNNGFPYAFDIDSSGSIRSNAALKILEHLILSADGLCSCWIVVSSRGSLLLNLIGIFVFRVSDVRRRCGGRA